MREHPLLRIAVPGLGAAFLSGLMEYRLTGGTSGWIPLIAGVGGILGMEAISVIGKWVSGVFRRSFGHVDMSAQGSEQVGVATPESAISNSGQPPSPTTSLSTIPAPAPTPMLAIDDHQRIFVRRTPQQLMNLVSEKTSVQTEHIVNPYKGSWIVVQGTAYDVSSHPSTKTINISIIPDKSEEDKHRALFVFMRFEQAPWSNALLALNRGDPIRAIGRIQDFDSIGLRLTDGELI